MVPEERIDIAESPATARHLADKCEHRVVKGGAREDTANAFRDYLAIDAPGIERLRYEGIDDASRLWRLPPSLRDYGGLAGWLALEPRTLEPSNLRAGPARAHARSARPGLHVVALEPSNP